MEIADVQHVGFRHAGWRRMARRPEEWRAYTERHNLDLIWIEIVRSGDLASREFRVRDDQVRCRGAPPIEPASQAVSSIWVPLRMPLVADVVNRQDERMHAVKRGGISRGVEDVQRLALGHARQIHE